MSSVTQLPLPFTVVLMRSYRFENIPEHEWEPETDAYIALVKAEDKRAAVKVAKVEAFEADCSTYGKDFLLRLDFGTHSYTHLVTFEGHQHPKLYGFQTEKF